MGYQIFGSSWFNFLYFRGLRVQVILILIIHGISGHVACVIGQSVLLIFIFWALVGLVTLALASEAPALSHEFLMLFLGKWHELDHIYLHLVIVLDAIVLASSLGPLAVLSPSFTFKSFLPPSSMSREAPIALSSSLFVLNRAVLNHTPGSFLPLVQTFWPYISPHDFNMNPFVKAFTELINQQW